MAEGIFKFYQNGELIGEQRNNLTETGRILAIKSLMGALPSFGNTLAIGVDSTANTLSNNLATNNRLGFQVAKAPVVASFLDTSVTYDGLVFKAKIEDPSSYRIQEAGLVSEPLGNGGSSYKSETLLSFEPSDNLESPAGTSLIGVAANNTTPNTAIITTSDNPNFKIGDKALRIKATETVTVNKAFTGLDSYANTDLLSVAYYADTDADVTIVFYSGLATMTFTLSYTGSAAYRVVSTALSAGTAGGTGTFSWGNITKITIASATSWVILDGIRLEAVSRIDSNSGLISRTAFSSTITKVAGIPLDIEYYLRLGFNV